MNQSIQTEKANQTLAVYLRGGRLPHALLIEGAGAGPRADFARQVARGALCAAEPEQRPCGVCRHCVKAEKAIHPDILTYGGEGGARSFHIETVRALRQQAHVQPNEAEAKVLLLLEVHNMSVQAQNALLKIIEEPPRGVYFVLTCENKAALLETILSRVAVVDLGPPPAGEAAEGEAELGDAPALELLYNLCAGSELDAMAALTAYERDRQGLTALLERMGEALGAAMLRPSGDQQLDGLVNRLGRLRLLEILAIIEDTGRAVNQNVGGLLLTTTLGARIRAALTE